MIRGYSGSYRYLPYTNTELINHLQTRFQENMTLDNYGTWQIDHIIPIKAKKKMVLIIGIKKNYLILDQKHFKDVGH